MKRIRKILKLVFASGLDVFRKGYSYHSGALTYSFMLSMAPLTIVTLNIAGLMPIFDINRVEEIIDRFFPQYTTKVVHEILEIQKRSAQSSLIALGLSYVFSVSFLKNMGKAFSFVSEGSGGERREIFYWFIMPVLVLAGLAVVSVSFFLNIYLRLIIPTGYALLINLSYALPVAAILFLIYRSFLKAGIGNTKLFAVSLFISLLMFFLQWGFTWYIAHLFKGSILYGSLSTIVVFLLWINLTFLTLLYGARLIYRIKNL